jgi:type II secretory pathway pseudopilin PulG
MNARARPVAGGFSLVEAVVACLLLGVLATLLHAAWSAFYRAATESASRCQLAQEADLALHRIAEDLAALEQVDLFGGATTRRRPLVGMRLRRLVADPAVGCDLDLCYDSEPGNARPDWPDTNGGTSPDTVVTYHFEPSSGVLSRRPGWGASYEAVTRHVVALDVRRPLDPWIELVLVLRHPVPAFEPGGSEVDLERSYTLLAYLP